jgi:hypothetical protein
MRPVEISPTGKTHAAQLRLERRRRPGRSIGSRAGVCVLDWLRPGRRIGKGTMMRRFPRTLSPYNLLIAGLLVLGLVLTVVFGGRALRNYQRLQLQKNPPGMVDVEAIRGWMTMPYIAQAYDVPEDELFAALGIPSEGNRNVPLRRLAERYGLDPALTRQQIQQAILRLRPATTPWAEP